MDPLKHLEDTIGKILSPRELYVRMSDGWTVQEAYFKTGEGEVVDIPVSYHIGNFSDSVLLIKGSCDWRFLPYAGYIHCYSWSDGIDLVKLENTASFDYIYRGAYRDILCKKGEITTVKREEYAGGFISPDGERIHSQMMSQDEIVRLLCGES